jgi:hypothetical protein
MATGHCPRLGDMGGPLGLVRRRSTGGSMPSFRAGQFQAESALDTHVSWDEISWAA